MTNQVQVIDKPNSQTEVQMYNKAAGRIAEVVVTGFGYATEFFTLRSNGEYGKLINLYRTETYACAVLAARKFAESGEIAA